ncbi:MAG: PD-(D/E)XK nuclease family protein, partial [Gemmatimonadota bacterium]|nr:PD-(D/E)XK nuclease family protein [Gemmatimonadota bacterium]
SAALERLLLQEQAEEARLLYVAATRARDRLLVVGPPEPRKPSFATWLGVELRDAREAHEVSRTEPDAAAEPRRAAPRAEAADPATGTGSQLDAFGAGTRPQLDLFAGRPAEPAPDGEPDVRMVVRRHPAALQTSIAAPTVSLAWLTDIEREDWPDRVAPVRLPAARRIGSATERMMESNDLEAWTLRYEHGVLPASDFLIESGGGTAGALPPRARGVLIHGILERIRSEEELGRVLEETIASLDLGDLETALSTGSRYRQALEHEIAEVIRSPEWRWYVEGSHFRELRFLYRSGDGWIQGAFDVLRPAVGHGARPDQVSLFQAPADADGTRHADPWVIDFKTHRIDEAEAVAIAAEYDVQIEVYREAAAALLATSLEGEGDRTVRVGLHFTHPNVAIER